MISALGWICDLNVDAIIATIIASCKLQSISLASEIHSFFYKNRYENFQPSVILIFSRKTPSKYSYVILICLQ